MPLTIVQKRRAVAPEFSYNGTQFVEGELKLNGPLSIQLAGDIYADTGKYVLFDYSAEGATFSYPGTYANGQAAVEALLSFDDDALALSGVGGVTCDEARRLIILRLQSKPDNGCQYVEDTLSITSPIAIELSPTLHATAGDYILFDYTGGTFVGDASNIFLAHPTLTVSVQPYNDPATSQIKFSLAE